MSASTEIVNYYTHLKSEKSDLHHYPNEEKIHISLPFRMLMCGPSGSGKTSLLLNFIKIIGIFDKIILLAKDLQEPLYKHLIETYGKIEKKLGIQVILAIDNIKDMPTPDDCDPKENTLMICDDLICEGKKDLDKVGAFWIRARKKGVSMVFLSQSYYAIPKLIRQNSSYVVIKKIDTPKDLKAMLKEYSLGVDIKELTALYHHAMKGDSHTSFFMIDTTTSSKALRFRANFAPILPN